MWPVAGLLAMSDRMQRKVRKTHRAFLAASKIVTITQSRMGRNA